MRAMWNISWSLPLINVAGLSALQCPYLPSGPVPVPLQSLDSASEMKGRSFSLSPPAHILALSQLHVLSSWGRTFQYPCAVPAPSSLDVTVQRTRGTPFLPFCFVLFASGCESLGVETNLIIWLIHTLIYFGWTNSKPPTVISHSLLKWHIQNTIANNNQFLCFPDL